MALNSASGQSGRTLASSIMSPSVSRPDIAQRARSGTAARSRAAAALATARIRQHRPSAPAAARGQSAGSRRAMPEQPSPVCATRDGVEAAGSMQCPRAPEAESAWNAVDRRYWLAAVASAPNQAEPGAARSVLQPSPACQPASPPFRPVRAAAGPEARPRAVPARQITTGYEIWAESPAIDHAGTAQQLDRVGRLPVGRTDDVAGANGNRPTDPDGVAHGGRYGFATGPRGASRLRPSAMDPAGSSGECAP